jgi:hypothetical protein
MLVLALQFSRSRMAGLDLTTVRRETTSVPALTP